MGGLAEQQGSAEQAEFEGAHHLSPFGKGLIPGLLGLIPGFTRFDSGACPVLHQDCGSSTRFLGKYRFDEEVENRVSSASRRVLWSHEGRLEECRLLSPTWFLDEVQLYESVLAHRS